MNQETSDHCASPATQSEPLESNRSGDAYTHQLLVRLTDEQYDWIVRIAAHSGISVEEAMRHAITSHAYIMQRVMTL